MLERPVFIREQSDGLYRTITYLVFKTLEEVVLTAVTSLAFSLLVFYTVRLQGSFFIVWLVFLITQLVGVGQLGPHMICMLESYIGLCFVHSHELLLLMHCCLCCHC